MEKMTYNPITGKLDMTGEADVTGEDILYTSETPTTVEVGGIPKGTNFDAAPLKDIINQMLHKPVAPALALSPGGTVHRERGTTWSGTIRATPTKGTGALTAISISRDGKVVAEEENPTGPLSFDDSTSSATSYTAKVTASDGLSAGANMNIAFHTPVFWGLMPPGRFADLEIPAELYAGGTVPKAEDLFGPKVMGEGFGFTKVVPTAAAGAAHTVTANYPPFTNRRIAIATAGTATSLIDPNKFDYSKNLQSETVSALLADGTTKETFRIYYIDPSSQPDVFACVWSLKAK